MCSFSILVSFAANEVSYSWGVSLPALAKAAATREMTAQVAGLDNLGLVMTGGGQGQLVTSRTGARPCGSKPMRCAPPFPTVYTR